MKRKFAPVMITAAALITTVPTTQVFASEGINAETASDNITPLVINTENTQNNTDGTITLTDISTVTVPSDPVAVKKIDTVKAANATLTCKAGEKPKFTATIPEGEETLSLYL